MNTDSYTLPQINAQESMNSWAFICTSDNEFYVNKLLKVYFIN